MKNSTKPVVDSSRLDGNIFAVLSACTRALKKANQEKEAKELSEKVWDSASYDEALQLCMKYVEFE